jgi:L-fuconate dehydratase
MTVIRDLSVHDVRFPTSDFGDGSDAMNPDPDYSAAFAILHTDDAESGHGMTFTIGRGTEICTRAIEAYRPFLVGRDLDEIESDLGAFWRSLAGDSQLRWLGPEKGVVHLALAAVVNAVWDLLARRAGKPLWQYLSDMSPAEIVRCVDFRHISDALSPEAALALLEERTDGRAARRAKLERDGYPAYLTSAGWIGYSEDTLRERCREAIAAGWNHFKVKVGADLADDIRRCRILRDEIGPDRVLMLDANQVWDVDAAIAAMKELSAFDPLWIEEPTSPDDILGHARIAQAVRPIGVATGEHCQNRVVFKQLLQANAIDFLQIDGCRLGGVNEVIAVLLLAAHFDVPVCPHAGGVGLCEHVQHFSAFDYLSVSGSLDGRMIEFADHLHDHFVSPVRVEAGRYRLPTTPGFATEMKPESLARFAYPDGPVWRERSS